MGDLESLIPNVMKLLPLVEDVAILLEIADDLEVNVPEESKDKKKVIFRLITNYLYDDALQDTDQLVDKLSGSFEKLIN